jgi:hypothetical protein
LEGIGALAGKDSVFTKIGDAAAAAGDRIAAAGRAATTSALTQAMNAGQDREHQAIGTPGPEAQAQQQAGEQLKDSGSELKGAASEQSQAAKDLSDAAAKLSQAQPAAGNGNAEAPQGQWTGGHIRGPGGPTDDRAGVYALSDNEYVVRSAAVSHYGVGLFDALNSLAVGGFATGGRVGGVSIPSVAGPHSGGSSILNLTIDGQHFNGLRAPNDVAAKLKMHAVTRQSSAAGKSPSWRR